MKKKLLGLMILAISTVFLVACSTNSLNVKYYKVYDGKLNVDLGNFYYNASGKETYYKEGSKALEKALRDKE